MRIVSINSACYASSFDRDIISYNLIDEFVDS